MSPWAKISFPTPKEKDNVASLYMKDDRTIIYEKDDKVILTFSISPVSTDWRKSFNIKLTKIEGNHLVDLFITQNDLVDIFTFFRLWSMSHYPEFYKNLSATRTTTLDYINIQNLGILDWTRLLANLDNAKRLTIRDRVAYARRHGWIPRVTHGTRKVLINV